MISILLIGYRRLEFILENLQEFCKIRDSEVLFLISIDGPKKPTKHDLVEQLRFSKKLANLGFDSSSSLIWHKENLGCDQHVPWAIEWSLKYCESVIVIEDDVRLSNYSMKSIIERLRASASDPSPVLGISCINRPNFFPHSNFWRRTPYFSAWGYGVNRHFWEQHKAVMRKLDETKNVDKVLKESKIWSNLTKRRRDIWRERFMRGNYDYRIQASMFALNIEATSPVFRIIDNIGHGQEGATHTRFKTPRYLRVSTKNQNQIFSSRITHKVLNKYLIFLDSQTWAGDGYFSIRGRNIGLRSFAKSYFSLRRYKKT